MSSGVSTSPGTGLPSQKVLILRMGAFQAVFDGSTGTLMVGITSPVGLIVTVAPCGPLYTTYPPDEGRVAIKPLFVCESLG